MEDKVKVLADLVAKSNNIVFFGGAGVSTASGLPDFRSATGLYNKKTSFNYSPEYMLSHDFLVDEPDEFSKYYKEELLYESAKPNAAHIALVKLEKLKKLKAVITQNIDGLHQMAGSTNVLELHGNLQDHYCLNCGKKFDLDYARKFKGAAKCDACKGFVRPDVVLYGESLDGRVIRKSIEYIRNADILIVAGTSLVVYPAAGFVDYYNGDKLVILNKQRTPSDYKANYVIHDDLTEVLKKVVENL